MNLENEIKEKIVVFIDQDEKLMDEYDYKTYELDILLNVPPHYRLPLIEKYESLLNLNEAGKTMERINVLSPDKHVINIFKKLLENNNFLNFIKVEKTPTFFIKSNPNTKSELIKKYKKKIESFIDSLIKFENKEDRKKVIYSAFLIKSFVAVIFYLSFIIPEPANTIIQTILIFLALVEFYKKMIFELVEIQQEELYNDKYLTYNPLQIKGNKCLLLKKYWILFLGYLSKFTGEKYNWIDKPEMYQNFKYQNFYSKANMFGTNAKNCPY